MILFILFYDYFQGDFVILLSLNDIETKIIVNIVINFS